MTREALINVYLDWKNNFLSIGSFADYYGFDIVEATDLINLAHRVFENKHPEA